MIAKLTTAQLAGLRHVAAINHGKFGGSIRRDVLFRLIALGMVTVRTEQVGGTTRRARLRTEIVDMQLTDAGINLLTKEGFQK